MDSRELPIQRSLELDHAATSANKIDERLVFCCFEEKDETGAAVMYSLMLSHYAFIEGEHVSRRSWRLRRLHP